MLLEDGSVRAFGEGDSGRLGYGSTTDVGGVVSTWARDIDIFASVMVVRSTPDLETETITSQLMSPAVLSAGSPSLPQAATSIDANATASAVFPASRLTKGLLRLWPEADVVPPASAMNLTACPFRPVAVPSALIGPGPPPMVCDFLVQDDWDVFRTSDSFGALKLNVSAWSCELAPKGTDDNTTQVSVFGSFGHVVALGLLEPGDEPSTFLVRADRPHELLPWSCAIDNVSSIVCNGSPSGTGGPQRSWLRLKTHEDLIDVSLPLPVPTRYAAPVADPDQGLGSHGDVLGARIIVRGHGLQTLPGLWTHFFRAI